jgi:hypothetical protein
MVCLRGGKLRAPTFAHAREYQNVGGDFGALRYRGVAQLVARTAGGREAASSSLVTPTKEEIIAILIHLGYCLSSFTP